MSIQEQQQSFNSENLNVKMSREPGSKVKLEIHVSPEGTQAAYQKALKTVNKEVNIPGFRKGKAPEAYIIQNFSKYIEQEWREILMETSFKEALDLVKIYPFNEKSLQRPSVRSVSKENGADIIFEYEAYPAVPSIDFQSISLKKVVPQEIKEDEVNNVLDDIRLHHATWEDVTDRPVQEGDFVELDIETVDEGKSICKDTRFEVKKGVLGAWLLRLILGLKVNDSVEGMSEKDPEESCETCKDEGNTEHHHHHHASNFTPINCKITIKSIKNAQLPELDNVLAEKTGVPTIEELRPKIKKDLEDKAANQARSRMRRQLEDQLMDNFIFDIPASVAKDEIKARISHELDHLDPSLPGDEKKAKLHEIESRVKKDVEAAYRLAFISNQIAKHHQIDVTSQEIIQEYMRQMLHTDNSLIHPSMQPEEIQARLRDFLVRNKIYDFLIEQAQKID